MGAALLCLLLAHAAGGDPRQDARPSIRGTVIDRTTSAPIADARVTLLEAQRTVLTGSDGRFEFLQVEARHYTLTVSTIGYIFVRRPIEVKSNTVLDLLVPLAEGTGTYTETVTVSTASSRRGPAGVSSQMELGSAALADLRGVAADDPLRAVQALPGVATGDDFQAGFSVRGSAFRQAGLVLDGVPAERLLHAVRAAGDTGSISMINTDVLERASLQAGPHARPHGDWLGPTLEIDLREGSRDRTTARAAVSGTSASTVLEGPVGRSRRGSWLLSVRQSYVDWLVRKIEPGVDSTIGFRDAQFKAAYDLTDRQQVQWLTVAGAAEYRRREASPANGLLTAASRTQLHALNWRLADHRFVLTQRLSVVDSRFDNRGLVGQALAEGTERTTAWRADLSAPINPAWTIEGGARVARVDSEETLRRFATTSGGSLRVTMTRALSSAPVVTSGWLQATWRRGSSAVVAGVRGTTHGAASSGVVTPWLLAEFTRGATTIRGSAGRSAQFHDPALALLLDAPVVAETAAGADLSVERRFSREISIQATAFHRAESDILRRTGEERLDPVTGARRPESPFPVFAASLEGNARGVDVRLMRRSPSGLSGWVGYTWAHARHHDRQTGERFDADTDQRHTVNVFAQQRFSYRMTASLKLRVGSNVPLVGYFEGSPDALRLSAVRNGVRLPVYARLDARANRTFTFTRSRLTLFVEVMNVLGRRNYGQADGSVRSNLEAVAFVERLLPRVPSAGFLIEF